MSRSAFFGNEWGERATLFEPQGYTEIPIGGFPREKCDEPPNEDETPALDNPWGRPWTLYPVSGDTESTKIARKILGELWDRHLYGERGIGAPITVATIAGVIESEILHRQATKMK